MRIKEIIALLIVKRILLVSIGGWIKRTVWRIWIPKVWRVTKVFHEPLTPLASPPAPPPQKKNLWSPFSYKLPVISSPTRTLLRQRYIGFAVPSFFFLLCYRYSKCTKKKTPLQKEWSFWLCCQAKKTLNCHGEIFIFARCISVVRVSENCPDICSLWC